MNTCTITGFLCGPSEIRVTQTGRRILNFQVGIDDGGPYVPIGRFLPEGETIELEAGERVEIEGSLKHHPRKGFYVAARRIVILRAEHSQP